jgi:hypothetical protein
MYLVKSGKSGEGGRGLEPASGGYLQYAVFALRRQEESELQHEFPSSMQELSHFPHPFVKSLQVLSS